MPQNSFASLAEYFLAFHPRRSTVTESEGIKILRLSLHAKRLVLRISAHYLLSCKLLFVGYDKVVLQKITVTVLFILKADLLVLFLQVFMNS